VNSSSNDSLPPRSPHLLSASRSTVLLIDVQEKLAPLVNGIDAIVGAAQCLLSGAKLFDVPVLASEQYPERLGSTVSSLAEFAVGCPTKRMFSSRECLDAWSTQLAPPRDTIVLCGIETHVCVQQTALDLISQGWNVAVASDAVGSRRRLDHDLALQRLLWCGCVITSVESILFEWCETSKHGSFRDLSGLIKSRPIDNSKSTDE
jgi:Isochorismatase family